MTDSHNKLAGFDPDLPLERAHTIPSAWYLDQDILDVERHKVFADTWQAVGRLDQVSAPGTFFTADIAGEPILIVRDEAGTLRAFSNVCRHRAARVMAEEQGRATRLRCRYHGWTYDLTGRLRGAPEFEGVADFCRDDYGLTPLIVETWGPTVWVHPCRPTVALADYLRPLPERTQPLAIDRLRWHARREYELACNWKVYVDNYLDGGYHVHTVHPGLSGVLDYAQYRTLTYAHASVQESPLKPAAGGAVEGTVRTGEAAYYWWVFPNFMVN